MFYASLQKQLVDLVLYLGCRNSTHCLIVTSQIILFLALLLCFVLRLIWTFCVYDFSYSLLPSDTVGRFCSV